MATAYDAPKNVLEIARARNKRVLYLPRRVFRNAHGQSARITPPLAGGVGGGCPPCSARYTVTLAQIPVSQSNIGWYRMAKKRVTRGPVSPDPAIEAKGQRMIANIRQFYQLGRRANELVAKTAEFARSVGKNARTMTAARRFADPDRGYTPDELEDLCQLRRPNGLPLHWGHVQQLITVPTKRIRRRLEREAAKEAWTSAELAVAVRQAIGRRRPAHGRPMKRPATPGAGLLQLLADSSLWRRRCEVAVEEVEKAAQGRLSRDLREQLDATLEELQEVAGVLRAARRRLKKARDGK